MLDAAARALLRRGYPALRYSDVSEESGVPVPSLQHRFVTLDRLRRAALCRKVRLELEELVSALACQRDPWEWIVAMIERSVALEPDVRENDWKLWTEYLHAAAHDTALAEDFDEVDRIWFEALEGVVARGIAEGRLRPQQSAADSARVLQGLIDGMGSMLAMTRTQEYVDETVRVLTNTARILLQPQPTEPGHG